MNTKEKNEGIKIGTDYNFEDFRLRFDPSLELFKLKNGEVDCFVFSYQPSITSKGHYHIRVPIEKLKKLRDWIDEALKDL